MAAKRKPPVRYSYSVAPLFWTAILAAVASAAAIWFFYQDGSLMNFGDAEAHLNTARRLLDSRTPGYDQLGTPWLPLPHLLMLPSVRSLRLWRTGLAGSIPAGFCFVCAATFLFATVRRVFDNLSSAALAAALFVLNPNALFLQSTAMTESFFFVCLFGLLFFSVLFQQTQSLGAATGAGLMALAGTLTRYEGWFLVPFCAIYLAVASRQNRARAPLLFCLIAGLGPLFWIAYNRWVFFNPLEFFNGPSSAIAIQGGASYPGQHNWALALKQFRAASELVTGTPLFWIAVAGILACAIQFKRALWPALFLTLPAMFYVWSIHSADTPIYVPQLYPHSWYNTRYGLALLPFAAFSAAAIVGLLPSPGRFVVAIVLLLAGAGQWVLYPKPEGWITWKEAQVNSEARRAWTTQASEFLAKNYVQGENIFSTPGDIFGIYRRIGLPLKQTVTVDNGPLYLATLARPDLFLWETWAVGFAGDPVTTAVDHAALHGPKYQLVKEIAVKGAPVLQIYRRPDAPHKILR